MHHVKDDKMKNAALFVLYYPTNKDIENICKMSDCFDICYVFDNTPTQENRAELTFEKGKFSYFSDGINHGLAYAYNFILNQSIKDHIVWLTLFDQDSFLDNKSIRVIQEQCKHTKWDVAIVCPYINYSHEDVVGCRRGVDYIQWTINSGSFLNVGLINSRCLSYDDNYFLDRLDRDFCKQVTNNGLKIMRINEAVMKQRLGEHIKGKNTHSPLRNYYMARNRLYYNKKYFKIPYRWILNAVQTMKHICGVFLSGNEIKNNISMVMRGLKDYRSGSMSIVDTTNRLE